VSVRIAAVGDVHVGTDTAGRLAGSFRTVPECADVLLLAGDLTRVGTVEETDCLISELEGVTVPIVAVLGNHDLHSDQHDRVVDRLRQGGVTVLEGDSTTVDVNGTTVGIAGVRGFGGGFVGASASDFGEPQMKMFVRTTRDAADRLHRALTELSSDVRIALLHYSPVPDTLAGEPLEIYPFLGSYLLAEAIDGAGADLVVHGHAHRGRERGMTPGGVRVRNVAMPVIGAPFRVYEMHAPGAPGHATDRATAGDRT
jgi:Icc-related predicted phosphoesterase